MPQKQQKQAGKSPKKNLNAKQSKKGEKKSSNARLSTQQIEQIQSQRIKQFFSESLYKIQHKINISPVDQAITANIMNGQIKVPQQAKKLSTLIKSPEQQAAIKITPEQMELYEKQAKRIQHLKLIANLNKQLSNKQPQQVIPYILTKQQHERKTRDIIEEKKMRQKRMEQTKQARKQRQQKEQRQAEQRAKQQKIQQKEKKRIDIEQKITKQKQQHIHFLSFDIGHRKDLEQVLTKVPLHVKMQENFKATIQLPELEQKKQQYRQLRDFKQRYSVDHIRQYQKEFSQKSKQKLQQSKMKRSNALTTIQQNMPKVPQKSQRLKSILAEQIHNMKRQWTEKDLYVEEKMKREQNYLKKLKEEYKPKIDKAKQQEIQKRLIKEKQHLSKVGLQIDQRKVGLQYLGEIKRLPKKRRQEFESTDRSDGITLRHQYRSETLLPSIKRSFTQQNPLERNRNTEIMLKIRQKRFSKILNSQEEPDRKLKMLQIQTSKIQQVKKQKLGFLKHNYDQIASKEASSLALNSIKAKMNLIQLMKKQ